MDEVIYNIASYVIPRPSGILKDFSHSFDLVIA
jgi:hypothetical protein